MKQYLLTGKRHYSTYNNLEEELNLDTQIPYVFDLEHLGVIKVRGEKSLDFLQGQLSCDVRLVNSTVLKHGALCNLKGRILALVDVIFWNESYHLVLPNDLITDTIASLNKTALLSQVFLEPLQDIHVMGFLNAESFLSQKGLPHYHLGGAQCIGLYSESMQECNLAKRGSLAWHFLRLNQQHIEIYPETRGRFLPHRLNLHHLDYLSFNKGCYKGQEIIARTHYRATLKHQLEVWSLTLTDLPELGETIYDAESQLEIGEIIDFTPTATNGYLVAVSVLIEHSKHIMLNGQKTQIISAS